MQHRTCTVILVIRTIGAERGRAARGAPSGQHPLTAALTLLTESALI